MVRATVASTADNDKAGALKLLDEACPMADRAIAARAPLARLARWDCDLSRADVLSDEGRFGEVASLMERALTRGAAIQPAEDPQRLKPIYQAAALSLLGDARSTSVIARRPSAPTRLAPECSRRRARCARISGSSTGWPSATTTSPARFRI